MCALEGGDDVAQAEAQLGDAVQEDEDTDGEAQDQLARILVLAHRYLTVHPYGDVDAVDTGLPAFSSSSAATT